MRWAALLLVLVALPAVAAPVVSPRPDRVAVTLYRDPARPADRAMNRDDLGGFALVTETRTVDLPAGRSELRFEDVAGGILPQSAVIRGLPGGTIEKNRDARLLSPGLLLDAHLGERVHLVRTDRRTGRVTQQDAVVRSTGDGVVIQTAAGLEALGCSGLPERLTYDAVPADLSVHPTLSVTTDSPAAVRAIVTLSYLASGFDWQANYVATIRPDGRTLDLVGWMTLANGNRESFADATLLGVAGRLNHQDERAPDPQSAPIVLSCWPRGLRLPQATSVRAFDVGALPAPPPPPPPPAPMMMQEVIVTGMRKEALLEALGDLKLYRVPMPVTVAAAGTKQVGLLHADGVRFARLYTSRIPVGAEIGPDDPPAMAAVLRTRNLASEGLGKPLPLGQLALFAPAAGSRLLLAEGGVRDLAVGEDWDIPAGTSPQVRLTAGVDGRRHGWVRISNADSHPIDAEVVLLGDAIVSRQAGAVNGAGRPVLRITVPANGSALARYRFKNAG